MILPIDEAQYRCWKGKRLPVVSIHGRASPQPRRATGIGAITSRRRGAASDLEYAAWRLGITVREVIALMEAEQCRR